MGELYYLKYTPLPINRFRKVHILSSIVNCTVFRNKRFLFCKKKYSLASCFATRMTWLNTPSTPISAYLRAAEGPFTAGSSSPSIALSSQSLTDLFRRRNLFREKKENMEAKLITMKQSSGVRKQGYGIFGRSQSYN
jgi:hypothetical protein